jgi:hyperosmotically inducible protein
MREPRHVIAGMALVLIAALAGACAETKDATVTGTVKTKLAADTHVKASEIEVQTANGVVTLTGNVDSQEAKDTALRITRETTGVRDVKDMISVRDGTASGDAPSPSRTVGERIDDAGITAKVKSRLLDDPAVRGLKIDVDTREGVVYLTGSIPGPAEREKAVQIARATEGVRNVEANFQ